MPSNEILSHRRVVRYGVVSRESPDTLAADVEVLLSMGWVPWGSMAVTQEDDAAYGWRYHQPMVVYGELTGTVKPEDTTPRHPDLHPDDDGDTRGIVLRDDPEA